MTDLPPEGAKVRVEIDTADLARLDLKPGELLVLRTPDDWKVEQAVALRDVVVGFLAEVGVAVPVLVLPKSVALAAVTTES